MGFELQISGVGSDRSTNQTTTTAQVVISLKLGLRSKISLK